ncbi:MULTISPECIES: acetyl-CoA C-acetyltransferase [Sphingobium]|uniref:acetyl-CoA C-acetyltransferase n=1 Tax=Sphingobium sp. MI1205 TaxID=407020 RepID=UPI00076FED82|nr:acetyl-CoA C-acetyltransferase [Sphingobium sp. MI1205]AMK19814.1 acetyl-CoA acetyltransferase [Sphingobium sp. MI1205]
MAEAYIVAAVRTAGGRRGGALRDVHPGQMTAAVLDELVARTAIDPAAIDDVILGCVSQVGEQSRNIARYSLLASRLPESVPATTIDRQCGSSQQAIHFAAQAIMAGVQDVVIAAGVESMTRVPMGSPEKLALDAGIGTSAVLPAVYEKYGASVFSQFDGAEMIADKHGLTRDELDRFALLSHQRAAAATQAGLFDDEILPLQGLDAEGNPTRHIHDEGIRYNASLEALGAIKPLTARALLTAGTSSQICDGASGVMLASAKAVADHGLTPLARIHHMTVTAGDPVLILEEPIGATRKAFAKTGMTIGDIDLYEVNEAFASIPLAWAKAIGADPERLNVHGGAIALGHPLGSSGTKLMTTLVHALRKRGKRYGLQTMCEGGGQANLTIVEAL